MKKTASLVIGLFLVALLVRVLVLVAYPFDGLYGQDAFGYYDYARQLWLSTRLGQAPAPFYWPLGYPALVALAFSFWGFAPRAGQIVSLLSGALIAPLVFWLTREAIASPIERIPLGAILAALVAAIGGELLQLSLAVMADAPAIMWAFVSALTLVRYTRTHRARWLLLASLTLALAILTRWVFGVLIAPWALACLLTWRSAGAKRTVAHAALAAALPLPLFALQYGALIPSNSIEHAWLVGWNPVHALMRTFDNADGHFEYALPVGLFYAQPLAHPSYLFPLLTPFVVVGLWAMRRATSTLRIVVVGWLAAAYLFLMGIPYENFRFGLTLWPPLVVLMGVGLEWVWQKMDGGRRTEDGSQSTVCRLPSAVILRGAPLVLILISLLAMAFWSARRLQTFFATKDQSLALVRQVEADLPPSSIVVTFGLTEFFKHYTKVRVVEFYNQNPVSLRDLACDRSDVFLVLDTRNVETQWANRAPELNLRWLRQGALLERGRYQAHTLYQIAIACP